MKLNTNKKTVTAAFAVDALVMIVMAIGNFLIPPVLTGIGFLSIAFIFFKESRLNQVEK